MLADLLRDAWLQYRRRPLAAVLLLLVTGVPPALQALPEPVRVPLVTLLSPVELLAGILLSLFLVPYLGGAINPAWPGPRAALPATLRSLGPALRAYLLWLAYVVVGVAAGMILDSFFLDLEAVSEEALGGAGGAGRARSLLLLAAGVVPLVAFATAFLTTLYQRVLLDGERRALLAATLSHRIAGRHFPLCLLIASLGALGAPVSSLRLELPARVALGAAVALLTPFTVGMANGLYLRTRDEALASLERAPTSRG